MKNSNKCLVFAHRGASKYYPENTLAAFRKAAELRVDYLETDVHVTKDSRFVIIHDDNVDRITNGKGRVKDYSLNELMEYDAGYNYTSDGINYPFRGKGIRLMTLEELLINFPDNKFNIDLKDNDPGQVIPFIEIIKKYNAENRIIAASKHKRNLKVLRKIYPEIINSFSVPEAFWIYLLYRLGILFLKRKFSSGIMQVPEYWHVFRVVSGSFVNALHKRGIRIHVWTIDEEDDMKRLLDMGVDGIMTNDPGKLMKVLGRV